jgi:hypothetical protein
LLTRFGLIVIVLSVLLQACQGSARPPCPPLAELSAKEWQEGLLILNDSIGLAESGDARAASDLFFADAHDLSHRAVGSSCAQDRQTAEDLSRSLDNFHLTYSPDDAVKTKLALEKVRESYLKAAGASGLSLR